MKEDLVREISQTLTDWYAISLRWLVLIGVAVRLHENSPEYPALVSLVGLWGLWNLASSIFQFINRQLIGRRWFHVAVDFLLFCLLFTFSGGLGSRLWWIGYFPIFTASIYLGWPGSVLMSLLVTFVQIAYHFFWLEALIPELSNNPVAASNLVAGIAFGLISKRILTFMLAWYRNVIRNHMWKGLWERTLQKYRQDEIDILAEELYGDSQKQPTYDAILQLIWSSLNIPSDEQKDLISALMIYDESGSLQFKAVKNFPKSDLGRPLAAKTGWLHAAVTKSKAVTFEDPSEDSELGKLIALFGCQSTVLLPLKIKERNLGMVLLAYFDQNYFNRRKVNLLNKISRRVVAAVQSVEIYNRIKTEKEQLLMMQESGRRHLVREMLFGPANSVKKLSDEIATLRMRVKDGFEVNAPELKGIEDQASDIARKMRMFSYSIRPMTLETHGLEAAIKSITDQMENLFGQFVDFNMDRELITKIGQEKQTLVFALIEDACFSVFKYSKASEIKIGLDWLNDERQSAILKMVDRGIGLEKDHPMTGLEDDFAQWRERIDELAILLGGSRVVEILSQQGVSVEIIFPVV